MKPTCATCRYWDGNYNECHRRAPTAADFPRVSEVGWCGEHETDLAAAGVDGEALFGPLNQSRVEMSPALYARQIPTFADWRLMRGKLFIARGSDDGNLESWSALYLRAGKAAMDDAYDTLAKDNPRVFFNAVNEYIEKHYEDKSSHGR
jgi:hypothetical protein